jgi:hypothetical protein
LCFSFWRKNGEASKISTLKFLLAKVEQKETGRKREKEREREREIERERERLISETLMIFK